MSIPNSLNDALIHLKASSNSIVFDALVVIRKFIAKNEQNIKIVREKHILKELTNILGKPNEKNLDVTLSILGNCCLENESRIELVQHGIVKAVVTAFNSSSRDTIQGRACRIIGNLALTYDIAVELHKENVINSLVSIVDLGGSNSVASQQMAVRALRILWAVESERVSMLELNVVRKVALLLTTPYEKKEQKELLKTVVKALSVFTYRCSEQCAIQVHPNGPVLKSLVSYWDKSEIKSSVILCIYNLCHIGSSRPLLGCAGVVKIIVNELSSSKITEPTESQSALMTSLCLLCRESVNRAKIRRAGGLPIILSILRDCQKLSLQTTALHALVLFVYDELSLQELLREGLVNVLVMKLDDYVKKHGRVHEQEHPKEMKKNQSSPKKRPISATDCVFTVDDKTEREHFEASGKNETLEANQGSDLSSSCDNWKRFRVSSPNYKAVVQEFGFTHRYKERTGSIKSPTHPGEFTFTMSSPEPSLATDYQVGEWSPGSSRSMCFSPESSPPYGWHWNFSPASSQTSHFDVWSSTSSPVSHGSVDCDIPEVYSPVCPDALSDDEDGIEDEKYEQTRSHPSEETFEEQSTDSPNIHCDSSPNDNWEVQSNPSSSGWIRSEREEGNILILLSRISHMENKVEDLVLRNTLSTLLNYIRLLRDPLPRAGRILGRIVRTYHYFIHLIHQPFVLNVYSDFCQPIHSSCTTCDKLNAIGKNLISKLSIIAESGFGEGELSHNIMKLEKSTREVVALTVPFVIKNQKILWKILILCNGLNVLQNMVNSYPENFEFFQEHIPICLSVLASSLHINSPVTSSNFETKTSSMNNKSEDFEMPSLNDNVTFILDNGESVTTSKTLLTEKSPVFEAMLQGSFKESKQESISLGDISSDALTHLLYVMKLGKVPCCLQNLNLSTALELLIILDRFLVPGSKELSELITNQFLQPCTALDVYNNVIKYKGILEIFDDLRKKTIQCILVTDMNMKKRREIFTELLKGPNSHQFQADLFEVLRANLCRRFF